VVEYQGDDDWAERASNLTRCVHTPSNYPGVFASNIDAHSPTGAEEEIGARACYADQQG
jgi:hypothetical protein